MWCLILFVVMMIRRSHGVDIVRVTTPVGEVLGQRVDDPIPYVAFLGIPYGDIDEEDPFGSAKPYPYFDKPFSADKHPPICPQIINDEPRGDIHCLYLNIFTPNNATTNSTLPVMVFVHGGFFVRGDGSFRIGISPRYLTYRNVIFVTMNYRLGPYGFLCLPELGYTNQGLKDVALALKWVKNNINNFGGDENNILLFGQGSGSALVEFLLLYNGDNVFNKVILQSGQIVSPHLAIEPADKAFVASIAEKLTINTKNLDIKEVVKQLSHLNKDLLINATISDTYKVCVDDVFITKTPKASDMSKVQIIVGTTEKEMYDFYKDEEYLHDIPQREMEKGFDHLPKEAVEKVKEFYLTSDLKGNVIDFGTDFLFNYPVERSVRFYIENNATVYRYVFSHGGGRNWIKQNTPATFGDDLVYIFGLDLMRYLTIPTDFIVLDKMTDLWTKFAQYLLDPVFSTNEYENSPGRWLKLTKLSRDYMNISLFANFSVQPGPYEDKIAFWDDFYHTYGKYSNGFNFGEYT